MSPSESYPAEDSGVATESESSMQAYTLIGLVATAASVILGMRAIPITGFVVGVTLLLVLAGARPARQAPLRYRLAFCATAGLCGALILLSGVNAFDTVTEREARWMVPFAWLAFSAIPFHLTSPWRLRLKEAMRTGA